MRILIITIERPFPPVSGAELRNWTNAMALAGQHEVTLAYLEPRPLAEKPMGLLLLPLAPKEQQPIWGDPRTRRSPIDLNFTPARLAAFDALLAGCKPDLLLLEGTALYPLAARARGKVPRLIVDFHNVESCLQAATHRLSLPAWRRFLAPRQDAGSKAIEKIEGDLLALADRIWVCSLEDAARLPSSAKAAIDVIPNAVPPGLVVAEQARALPDKLTALFLGHLAYSPNVAAASFIAKKLAPRLPQVSFILAGRAPTRRVKKMVLAKNLQLIADPKDVAPLYRQASLALLPLFAGGGTRIKALEAMALGLPLVATPLAVEGLGLIPGQHYLAAKSAAEFCAAIESLAKDSALYSRLSAAGLARVKEAFTQEAVAAAIRRALP